jgi:hypothetical protein
LVVFTDRADAPPVAELVFADQFRVDVFPVADLVVADQFRVHGSTVADRVRGCLFADRVRVHQAVCVDLALFAHLRKVNVHAVLHKDGMS